MARTFLAAGALLAALIVAFFAVRPPPVEPATASPERFSAERAMHDVREMSRAPRPTGSAENERVRTYLMARMRELGLGVSTQVGPLPAKSAQRLAKWGDADAARAQVVNLIGVLPGRDSAKPAILMMAHHDSVWASPGAADDAAGVAAALEVARAVKSRGIPERDLVLLFTDAEEIGLDGAELFFETHPLARRIGAVVNMETRGGGGRAAMFETGRGNAHWIDLYRRSVDRPSSNSMAVLVYELMPNNTDFTIPKNLGIPGFNIAFIGKPELYHSPASTAEALEVGSLQDLGQQALGVTRVLASSRELPGTARDAVFGDVLGLFVIAYSPALGWGLLAAAALLFGFAAFRARSRGTLTLWQLGGGAATALAMVLHTALLLRVGNRVSGSGGDPNYYDRLAAIPRLELQAFLLCLAALLLACVWARPKNRLLGAVPAMALLAVGLLFGGWSALLVGLAVASAASALLLPSEAAGAPAGWFGVALLVFIAAVAVQIGAPTVGPLLAWPLFAAGLAAAIAAAIDPELRRPAALVPVALVAALAGGQILSLAHFTFLGVGAPMAEAMTIYALLTALLLWPLLRLAARPRFYAPAALLLTVVAAGTALSVRLDPMAETIPPYSERR